MRFALRGIVGFHGATEQLTAKRELAPRLGFEPRTRSLGGSRAILLCHRGDAKPGANRPRSPAPVIRRDFISTGAVGAFKNRFNPVNCARPTHWRISSPGVPAVVPHVNSQVLQQQSNIPLPRYFLLLVAAMVAVAPFAIDTYLPALPAMADALGVDIVQMNWTVSAYLVGFAIGQLVGGPISDQIGRRKVGIPGLLLFVATSLLITLADSARQIQVLRVVQAFGGGFASVICMAMIRDAYPAAEAAKRFPLIMLVMLSAPLIAPLIGAFLLELGWPSIFLFLAAYALVVLAAFATLPETLHKPTGKIDPRKILPQYIEVLVWRTNGRLVPLRYILTQGLIASVMMNFLTNSAFIYMDYFEVGEKEFALYFGANVLSMMLFTLATSRLIHRVPPFKLFRFGRRLQLIAIFTLTALVVFDHAGLWLFTPLLALSIGCAGLIGPSISGLFLAPFGKLSGSASSLINTATFLFGSLFGILSGLLYDGSLNPVVLTMAGAVLLANAVAATIPEPKGFVT